MIKIIFLTLILNQPIVITPTIDCDFDYCYPVELEAEKM